MSNPTPALATRIRMARMAVDRWHVAIETAPLGVAREWAEAELVWAMRELARLECMRDAPR